MKHLPISASVLLLLSCTGVPGSPGFDDPLDPVPIDGDAGVCAHPGDGCPCDQTVPIDCYLDPTTVDGTLTCHRGTRYCRSGTWSTCESVNDYQFVTGPGIAPLVTGPSACNPCDPSCAVSRDIPSPADLPGHSTSVSYDPGVGGIGLTPDGGMGMPVLTDSDGDGIPDIADDCVGPGAFRNADGSCYGDVFFYHDLPYGGPAEIDPLDVNVQVRTADIYFLMDTTGSMGGEIANLKRDLTTGSFLAGCGNGIVGAIRCTIPDAWFGVGQHDDYPVSPYGDAGWGDIVYRNWQNITASLPAAQAAVNSLALHYGMDGPESQSQALWAIATGGGLGPYLAPQTGCVAPTWGYPCFRAGTIPIVILFTDAPFHNGPYGYNYSLSGGAAAPLPPTTAVSGNLTPGTARYTGDAATTWTGWTGNTCGAGSSGGGYCGASASSPDVWFRFDVSVATSITVSLEGSTYDTVLTLYDGSLTPRYCNDDAVGLQSRMTLTLTPGTWYAVVEGYGLSCGNYRFSVGNPLAGAPPPPGGYPVSWAEAVAAMNARNIRIITVHSGGSYGIDDANALADATSSYSSTGARMVFPISWDGTGLSGAVVSAVRDLANYNRMDISARAVDNTLTAIDERGFVDAIAAVGWGPGSCTGISGGSTFVQCLPGTSVDFNISFRNDIVMPTAVPQVFDFFIEVIGDGVYVLERIPVRIVVPASVPLYPPSGTYWRDYDSTLYCASNERPDWGNLTWEMVSLPAGTSVRWELRAAATLAGLAAATPVTFVVPGTSPPVDIAARLLAAGVPVGYPYLRVTSVLISNTARTQTPVLRSFEVRYSCVPEE